MTSVSYGYKYGYKNKYQTGKDLVKDSATGQVLTNKADKQNGSLPEIVISCCLIEGTTQRN